MHDQRPEDTYAKLAELRKFLKAELQRREAEKLRGEKPREDKRFRSWRRQAIAILIGLPRMCRHHGCRRHKCCIYLSAPCLEAHRETATARIGRILGHEPFTSAEGAGDDLKW